MKVRRDHDGPRLWAVVTATVRPLGGRSAPVASAPIAAPTKAPPRPAPLRHPPAPALRTPGPPQAIEPRRRRAFERGPDGPGERIDLHGHGQDSARALLTRLILARHAEGCRAVLVITGKGALGEGVLRRRVPDWLAQPPLRGIVAGVCEAHRRHGGDGALYVALKRRVAG